MRRSGLSFCLALREAFNRAAGLDTTDSDLRVFLQEDVSLEHSRLHRTRKDEGELSQNGFLIAGWGYGRRSGDIAGHCNGEGMLLVA